MFEIIVIGTSAAGISSSIYLKRYDINFSLIGKEIGGKILKAGDIQNYPGYPHISGVELIKKFKEHLIEFGIEPIYEEVLKIERKNSKFHINTNKNSYETKAVIIASGSSPKRLDIPGESEFLNKGVSYCVECDGPLFKEKIVAIIGGGNSAIKAGILLSSIAKKVYILNNEKELRGEKLNIKRLENMENVEILNLVEPKEIIGDKFVNKLKFFDLRKNEISELEVNGVFIYIGMKPNTDFIPEEWDIKNAFGEIIINKFCETKIPGVFAAGDCTDIPYKQIGIAVGHGIIAALSAIKYLSNYGI